MACLQGLMHGNLVFKPVMLRGCLNFEKLDPSGKEEAVLMGLMLIPGEMVYKRSLVLGAVAVPCELSTEDA